MEPAASRRARTALEQVPSHERDAVDLAYGGGHTHTEVARLLGVESAHVLVRDGLRGLRQALAPDA